MTYLAHTGLRCGSCWTVAAVISTILALAKAFPLKKSLISAEKLPENPLNRKSYPEEKGIPQSCSRTTRKQKPNLAGSLSLHALRISFPQRGTGSRTGGIKNHSCYICSQKIMAGLNTQPQTFPCISLILITKPFLLFIHRFWNLEFIFFFLKIKLIVDFSEFFDNESWVAASPEQSFAGFLR